MASKLVEPLCFSSGFEKELSVSRRGSRMTVGDGSATDAARGPEPLDVRNALGPFSTPWLIKAPIGAPAGRSAGTATPELPSKRTPLGPITNHSPVEGRKVAISV